MLHFFIINMYLLHTLIIHAIEILPHFNDFGEISKVFRCSVCVMREGMVMQMYMCASGFHVSEYMCVLGLTG